MNSQQCMTIMAALESGCQSSAEFWTAVAELSRSAPQRSGASDSEGVKRVVKKAKKAAAVGGGGSEAAPAAPKEPSAWNVLVSQTVAEMKQSGWQGWTDLKGVLWPGSKKALLKDKKGVEAEHYVYDGGEHDGKQPSPALGGMVRASYLKAQSEPEHAAKVAKAAEKRSAASASTSEAEGEAPAKKGGRPKMTLEQKAVAKAKRDAKKAAEALPAVAGLQGEWAE